MIANGTAEIATSSREGLNEGNKSWASPSRSRTTQLIAVIVNPDKPSRTSLDRRLRDIYAGKMATGRKWAARTSLSQLVNRDRHPAPARRSSPSSPDGEPFDRRAAVLSGTGQVRDVVSRTRGAIGYISMGFVESKYAETQVRAINVNHVEPIEATVASGGYPISRDLCFLHRGQATDEAGLYRLQSVENGRADSRGRLYSRRQWL